MSVKHFVNNPAWDEAMYRAAQARRLVGRASTLESRLHLKTTALFFVGRASELRRRDQRHVTR